MSRFTFTLALAMVAVFAFGQRVTVQGDFTQKHAFGKQDLKQKTTSADKSVNLNILFEENFDAYGPGTNGAPAGWVINSTVTDTLDQWRSLMPGSEQIGAPYNNGLNDRDEELISPSIPVNAVAPALWFEFMCHNYWYVDQNSDDLFIYVSDDDFATETLVWKEDDQALVEASGVPWPYETWVPYTAKIDLSAWAGSNIKVKLHLKSIGSADGTKGVSFYVLDFKSVETPGYDLEITNSYANVYDYGMYALWPQQEVRHFWEFSNVALNAGGADLTAVTFHNELTLGGYPILEKDTNFFISGNQDLAVGATDTFRVNDMTSFDMYTILPGVYNYKQTIMATEGDDVPDNNSWEFPIEITNSVTDNTMARETRATTVEGPDRYTGATPGDELGYTFTCMKPEHMESVTINISSSSDEGTTVRAKLYKYNSTSEEYDVVGQSDDYDIEAADLGQQVNLSLLDGGVDVDSLATYLIATAFWWEADVTSCRIFAYGDYPNENMFRYQVRLYIQGDATWYYISNMPMILMHFTPIALSVNEVAVNDNVKVYPNPTTGTLHVNNLVEGSTIRVYNMVGAEVEVIENASEFNTLDLSSFNEGTYLVKVFSNDNVVVKKINLVK